MNESSITLDSEDAPKLAPNESIISINDLSFSYDMGSTIRYEIFLSKSPLEK